MNTIGSRLKALRNTTGVSQAALAEKLGVTQSAINRYENDQSDVSNRVLLWYAEYFDVSLDYIFCRTDSPQGKQYDYKPKNANPEQWQQFVEACFQEGSPVNAKLKNMIINMAGSDNE